jgi:hypothetical protein
MSVAFDREIPAVQRSPGRRREHPSAIDRNDSGPFLSTLRPPLDRVASDDNDRTVVLANNSVAPSSASRQAGRDFRNLQPPGKRCLVIRAMDGVQSDLRSTYITQNILLSGR